MVRKMVALSAITLILGGSLAWVRSSNLLKYLWTFETTRIEAVSYTALLIVGIFNCGAVAISLLTGALMEIACSGFLFIPALAAPKAERVSPCAGLRRMGQALLGLPFGIIKAGICLVLFCWFLYRKIYPTLIISVVNADERLSNCLLVAKWVWIAGLTIFSLLALTDFCWQFFSFYRKHRMSDQEVKNEIKENEGSQLMRAYRKAEYEFLTYSEIVKRVKRAKVVLVDPGRGLR